MAAEAADEPDRSLTRTAPVPDVKLERCKSAAQKAGVDRFLWQGASALASRASQYLSSAGYKVVQESAQLAAAPFGDDLTLLLSEVGLTPQSGPFLKSFQRC